MNARSAAAIAGALLWTVGCKDKHQLATPPPPLVEVAMATQADVPIYHEWIGVLDGLVNAQIRAQVTGYLHGFRDSDDVNLPLNLSPNGRHSPS